MTILHIVRGLPGSGKSTLAKSLAELKNAKHVEADMFFVKDGEYNFDLKQIGAAHKWCLDETEKALTKGIDVYVSNAFVRLWEMKPYISLADSLGSDIQLIEVHSEWKNTHDVPDKVLFKMLQAWQSVDRTELEGWKW